MYFDRVTATVRGGGVGPEAPVLRAALESLETDSGIHQLVPYFVRFAQEEVATSLKNLPRLTAVVAATRALVSNPHVHVELYLHQLMPSVVTCLVAKKLGGGEEPRRRGDHCALRERAAETMALVCSSSASSTRRSPDARIAVKALSTRPSCSPWRGGWPARSGRGSRACLSAAPAAILETLEPELAEGDPGPPRNLEHAEPGPLWRRSARRHGGTRGACTTREARRRAACMRRSPCLRPRRLRRASPSGGRAVGRYAKTAPSKRRLRAPGQWRGGKSERRPGLFAWTSPARRLRSPSAAASVGHQRGPEGCGGGVAAARRPRGPRRPAPRRRKPPARSFRMTL